MEKVTWHLKPWYILVSNKAPRPRLDVWPKRVDSGLKWSWMAAASKKWSKTKNQVYDEKRRRNRRWRDRMRRKRKRRVDREAQACEASGSPPLLLCWRWRALKPELCNAFYSRSMLYSAQSNIVRYNYTAITPTIESSELIFTSPFTAL